VCFSSNLSAYNNKKAAISNGLLMKRVGKFEEKLICFCFSAACWQVLDVVSSFCLIKWQEYCERHKKLFPYHFEYFFWRWNDDNDNDDECVRVCVWQIIKQTSSKAQQQQQQTHCVASCAYIMRSLIKISA